MDNHGSLADAKWRKEPRFVVCITVISIFFGLLFKVSYFKEFINLIFRSLVLPFFENAGKQFAIYFPTHRLS